jgi:hypothetical protein
MPLTASGKPIEHIRFFNGQQLFASDLQDLEEFNRAMRWLHNQSLHQAGLASGYAATGNKGDSQITVLPGYAIDSQGREIVLEKMAVLQVPPVANDGQGNPVYYDLVVSYPADSVLTETRDGVCVARSAVRLRDMPIFCWAELAPSSDLLGAANPLDATRKAKLAQLNQDIESGNRIRLARAEVINCQLNQPLSIAERRNARPSLQPYISAGNTFNLTGTPWTTAVNALGIMATLAVDTSAANFRSMPQYSANVVGSRSIAITIGAKTSTVLIDGFVRIDTPTMNSFQLSMVIPAVLLDRNLGSLTDVAKALQTALNVIGPNKALAWYVVWMGVE